MNLKWSSYNEGATGSNGTFAITNASPSPKAALPRSRKPGRMASRPRHDFQATERPASPCDPRDAPMVVRPHLDNLVLLQVPSRLLRRGLFVGRGQIVTSQGGPIEIDRKRKILSNAPSNWGRTRRLPSPCLQRGRYRAPIGCTTVR
jgi:hypothetical protein